MVGRFPGRRLILNRRFSLHKPLNHFPVLRRDSTYTLPILVQGSHLHLLVQVASL